MNLRRKKEEIRAQGEVARKAWSLDEGSTLVRIYDWWSVQSGKTPGRENLCHFTRVIVFWAPLWWLAQTFFTKDIRLFGRRIERWWISSFVLLVFAELLLLQLFPKGTGKGTLGVLAFVYLVLGILTFVHVAGVIEKHFDEGDNQLFKFRWGFPGKWRKPLTGLLVVLTFPLWAALCVALGIVVGVIWVAMTLSDHKLLAPLFGVAVVVVIGLEFYFEPLKTLITFGVIAAFLAVLVGLVFLASWLGDVLKKRREARRRKRQQEEARRRREAEAAVMALTAEERDQLIIWQSAVSMIVPPPAEPSWIRKLVSGLVDFLSMLWQFIVAKKWKICPFIDLPEGSSNN